MKTLYSKNRLLSTVTSIDCKSGFNSLAVNPFKIVVFVVLVVGMMAMNGVVKAEDIFSVAEKTFSDNFPLLREKEAGITKKCKVVNDSICLPANCELDLDKGNGKGYEYIDHGHFRVMSHSYNLNKETSCLNSYVKVCTDPLKQGYKFDGEHVIYGKCTENAGTIKVTPTNPEPLCDTGKVSLQAVFNETPSNCQWHRNEVKVSGATTADLTVSKGGKYQLLCDNAFSEIISIPQCMQGTVWHDLDGDGIRDTGEPLLKDVWISSGKNINSATLDSQKVEFTGNGDNFQVTTDSSGKYSFLTLEFGSYAIQMGDNNPFGYPEISKPESPFVYGVSLSVYEDYDFGLKLPASVSGTVRKDETCNNDKDKSNDRIGGLTVRAGNHTAVTDANGEYTIYFPYVDSVGTKKVSIMSSSLEDGWKTTFPVSGETNVQVNTKYDVITGVDFWVSELPSIVGFVQKSGKEVTSPVATMGSSYDLPNKITLSGGGEFEAGDWYYYAGSQKVVVTKAEIEDVTYYTSYESNGCATEAALEVKFNKTADAQYISMSQSYRIIGTANNQPYSWKITDDSDTLIEECRWADPVPSGSNDEIELAKAFVESINGNTQSPQCVSSNSVEAKIVTSGNPSVETNSFKITNPSPGAKLYVGLFNQEANCLVDGNPPVCAYNPSIKEVDLMLKCTLPPQNMLVQYKLDDNADNTYRNNPTSVIGKVDNALSFDGSNYVEIPHSSELNIGDGDFSVTAWVKTAQESGFGTILNKGSENQGYTLYIDGGNLGFRLATDRDFYYTSDEFIADDEWHLVTVTVDRDNPEGGLIAKIQ